MFQTGLKETAMAKQVELTHFETQSCNYIAKSFEIMPMIFFSTWLIVISWVWPPVVLSWIYPPPSNSGTSRFIEISEPKNVIILVVIVTESGG